MLVELFHSSAAELSIQNSDAKFISFDGLMNLANMMEPSSLESDAIRSDEVFGLQENEVHDARHYD
jgi:hypothetical protein